MENMKNMMPECTQPWSHIVSFIIHLIYYWQVQVGVKSSAAAEKYAMHGIDAVQMFKAFPLRGVELLPAIVQAQASLGFPPQAPSAEIVKVQNKRTEVGGGVGWGCVPCLEAHGWLCWFTACQCCSLWNSGDKCSQMLWPYYGKEVCWACWWVKTLPVEWTPSQPSETEVCLCPAH